MDRALLEETQALLGRGAQGLCSGALPHYRMFSGSVLLTGPSFDIWVGSGSSLANVMTGDTAHMSSAKCRSFPERVP